jgi:hypothetical protein
MPITESKLKTGVLTLGGTGGTGGTDFACQATNVRIVPTFNDESDAQETLCGDSLAPFTTAEWALQGTSIQDFDDPAGFIKFSWDNSLTNVEFSWQPNAGDTIFSGTVQVRALEVGGDVNSRLTTDFDWPISGDPTVVWPTPPPLAEEPTEEEPSEDEPVTTAYSHP